MFFKTRKHKQFTYVPRFYDQRKEELEERIKNVERKIRGEKSQIFTSRLMRGTFRQQGTGRRVRQGRSSSIRLIVIVILLLLVIYIFYMIY